MPRLRHVSIPTPCAEDWQRMTPAGPTARFCDRCAHAVTDFSAMAPHEIAEALARRKGRVCGRFRPSQLGAVNRTLQPPPSRSWRAAAVAALGVGLATAPAAQAQEAPRPAAVALYDAEPLVRLTQKPMPAPTRLVIEGRVTEHETDEPLPGASVYVDGTDVGTAAGADGRFRLDLSGLDGALGDTEVVIAFVGFEPRRYALAELLRSNADVALSIGEAILLGELHVAHAPEPLYHRAWEWLRGLF